MRIYGLLSTKDANRTSWKKEGHGNYTIQVRVSKRTRGSDVHVELSSKRLKLSTKEEGTILEGSFPTKVSEEDCHWTLETTDALEEEQMKWIQLHVKSKESLEWMFLMEHECKYDDRTTHEAYMDVSIGTENVGRIVFGLYGHAVPKTVNNFVSLCLGDVQQGLCYRGCVFHRIIPGFMCQGGDVVSDSGTDGRSIYGTRFDDESFVVPHDVPYVLSMANSGPNTNASQFFITTVAAPHLDGKNVAFGKVIHGHEVISRMEAQGSASGRTKQVVRIVDCGIL